MNTNTFNSRLAVKKIDLRGCAAPRAVSVPEGCMNE